jgi:hypothetical protein
MSEQPTVTADPGIEHVVTAWDEALGAKDLDAAMALYHRDCVLESPLVCHLLGTDKGVLKGRGALRAFVAEVFAHQPPERRGYRTGLLTDGERVIWEYPRESPDGEHVDFAEVMEIHDGRIARHRVYWGWKGVGMLVRGEHGR